MGLASRYIAWKVASPSVPIATFFQLIPAYFRVPAEPGGPCFQTELPMGSQSGPLWPQTIPTSGPTCRRSPKTEIVAEVSFNFF